MAKLLFLQILDFNSCAPQHLVPLQHNEEDVDRGEKRRLQQWKAQIPAQHNAPPLQHRLAAWAQSGYDLVKSEHSDARQQILQGLHSDGGLMRVRELLEMAPSTEQIPADGQKYLATLAGPLLHTISHHEVANSAFLEHDVDGIHIFIYGTGGRRAVPFFTCLSGIFTAMPTFSPASCDNLLGTMTVMHRIVEINGNAQVNEDLQIVVNTFEELLQQPRLKDDIKVMSTKKLLGRIKRRMGLGQALPEAGNPDQTARALNDAPPTFDVGRDMPGMLSPDGPRHDNDHEDIQQIRILPTEDELASADRAEYLPTRDPRSLHLPGVEGLLDRHFRLIREDTVGQLRDAIRYELQKLRHRSSFAPDDALQNRGARTSTYHDIQLEKLHFDLDGVCAEISFAQPHFLASRSDKERECFYENTKRLGHGSLLCLVSTRGSATFFSVSETQSSPQNKRSERTHSRLWQEFRGNVMIRLTEPHEFDIQRMMGCFANHDQEQKVLVEFPGILLPAFYHTLAALKRMSANVELPFADMIAPITTVVNTKPVKPQPPQYSLVPGFAFDLSSLINEEDYLELRPDKRFDFAKLQAHSTLDDAQQRAVIDALTRRLALIQGPPGTGKSFTGVFLVKALLANAKKAKLGPIICVCYTNHALDQVLKHLIDEDVKQVIRIGGQSKSEILKPLNLREVSYVMDTTATERHTRWQLNQSFDDSSKTIRAALDGIKDPGTWDRVEAHLDRQQHFHLQELQTLAHSQIDEEGFEEVSYDRRSPLEQWLKPNAHAARAVPQSDCRRPIEQLTSVSVFAMAMDERFLLFQHWQSEVTERLIDELIMHLKECSKIRDNLRKCRQEKDLRCLRGANVIGITTTGLARNLDLLRHLPSKVLLCEEAGEMLEAHLLTAILPSIEHCILIGDHEQLRPQIASYELQSTNRRGEQYSLDVSLFERLIHPPYPWTPKVTYSTLEVQRRMHPSISELVRTTLYPRLKDHVSVLHYPEIKGISKRLYWLDHNVPEAAQESTSSHSNDYEVEVTAALLTHLVRQGEYQPGEIAVLTPYLGQFVKLRKRLSSQFEITVDEKDADELRKQGLEGDSSISRTTQRTTLLKALRLATIDNFQGEEAKVVVISLVRSNAEKKCGFLNTSNRINVLLSRARHGMYLIGDSACYQCGHQCPSVCGERCPSEAYCQQCATEDIKKKVVDYTEFSRYCDLNLDEDPCYVLACGHILSIGSLDGIMGMEEHYEVDTDHKVLGINSLSEPFSVEQKNCPECRHPLRNLQRYNHIWRRGQLDESTKKFISWSTATFVPLSKRLDVLEGGLSKNKIMSMIIDRNVIEDEEDQGVLLDLELSGSRDEITSAVTGIKDLYARYEAIGDLRKRINKFLKQVTEDEQPFGRVYNMLQGVLLTQRDSSIRMARDDTILQPRQRLLATSLSLRCDLVILADFLQLRKDNSTTFAGKYDWRTLHLNLQLDRARRDCLALAAEGRERTLPATEVEAVVYFVRFTALEWSIANETKRTQLSSLRTEAQTRLAHARQLCTDSPDATTGLLQELEQAEKSLRDSTFYATVTNEERRQVVAAMATEFQVNGHWYRCPNGHPFTIANCGQAMQESNCPECGARVGGTHHQLREGNTQATDIEQEFGRMTF